MTIVPWAHPSLTPSRATPFAVNQAQHGPPSPSVVSSQRIDNNPPSPPAASNKSSLVFTVVPDCPFVGSEALPATNDLSFWPARYLRFFTTYTRLPVLLGRSRPANTVVIVVDAAICSRTQLQQFASARYLRRLSSAVLQARLQACVV